MENNDLIITDDDLSELREAIRPYLTEKRYLHTLAVEEEAASLAKVYLPEKENKLRASALLHDITKMLSLEKQLQYCGKFGIIVGKDDILSPKIFHAKTAASLAVEVFPKLVDEEIAGGIRWHTTGRYGMTLFESIVYLADYIEKTRTFGDCLKLREYFYSELESGRNKDEVFTDTMIMSFDMTISCLMSEGALIDNDTVEARNYFLVRKTIIKSDKESGGAKS